MNKRQHAPKRAQVGPYIVDKSIGSGSFATVWKAHHHKRDVTVAIKSISREKMKLNKKHEENLRSEIKIMKELNHTNTVHLFEIIPTERHIYLVMEYCGGGDLSRYIKTRGPMCESQAKRFLRHLARGLLFLRCHNLIHRDLKPQNLLLTEDSPNATLKIADFGFARHIQHEELAATLCGSPLYMAPEILRYQKYDAKADLWSVGTILFEMVTGRPPFNGSNHMDLLRKIDTSELRFPSDINISPTLLDLLQKLLKRNPLQRLSFEEFFRHPFVDQGEILSRSGANISLSGPKLHNSIISSSDASTSGSAGADSIQQHRRNSSLPASVPEGPEEEEQEATSAGRGETSSPQRSSPQLSDDAKHYQSQSQVSGASASQHSSLTASPPRHPSNSSPSHNLQNLRSSPSNRRRASHPHRRHDLQVDSEHKNSQSYRLQNPSSKNQFYKDTSRHLHDLPGNVSLPRSSSKDSSQIFNPNRVADVQTKRDSPNSPVTGKRTMFVNDSDDFVVIDKTSTQSGSSRGSNSSYVAAAGGSGVGDVDPSSTFDNNSSAKMKKRNARPSQLRSSPQSSNIRSRFESDQKAYDSFRQDTKRALLIASLADSRIKDKDDLGGALGLYNLSLSLFLNISKSIATHVNGSATSRSSTSLKAFEGMQKLLRQLASKSDFYIKKAKSIRTMIDTQGDVICPEKLIYEAALDHAREAAGDEVMLKFKEACYKYRKAYRFLKQLSIGNSKVDEHDRRVLDRYMHDFYIRIQKTSAEARCSS